MGMRDLDLVLADIEARLLESKRDSAWDMISYYRGLILKHDRKNPEANAALKAAIGHYERGDYNKMARSLGPILAILGLVESKLDGKRRSNSLPDRDSGWYRFAREFDIGVADLDKLAYNLRKVMSGNRYADFEELEITIGARELLREVFKGRAQDKFARVLRDVSVRASDLDDDNLMAILREGSAGRF